MDIDVGQLVYPSLKDCPVVVDLHELSPVGRRATGGRDWRRRRCTRGEAILAFARLRTSGSTWAGSCRQSFGHWPRLGCNAMSRMSPPHPGHSSGNSSPTRAMSFAHAIREVSWEGGLSHESQQSAVASPRAACPPTACPSVAALRRLPTFPIARAVTADLSL